MPDSDAIRAGRDAVVREHGVWTGHNIHLGGGVWTMDEPVAGAAERNAQRISQVVNDLVGGMEGLRVVDLGAGEGIYSVELAGRGASVVAVEGRPQSAEKIRFAKWATDLDGLDVVCADVREFVGSQPGNADVALCLGILYHIDAESIFSFVESIAAMTERVAVFGGMISLAARESERFGGSEYAGRTYPEGEGPWASLGNAESFWFTKPSLLRLLDRVGFTTVLEVLNPPLPELDAHTDHVTLVAMKGERAAPVAAPGAVDQVLDDDAWPEAPKRRVHPTQRSFLRIPVLRVPVLRAWHRRRLARTFRKERA